MVSGTDLVIPNKLHNAHNTDDTYRVYDPNVAIGNVVPTVPKPTKSGGCGGIGQIIMVVVAVVVAYFTAGAALGLLGVAQGATATSPTSSSSATRNTPPGTPNAEMGNAVCAGAEKSNSTCPVRLRMDTTMLAPPFAKAVGFS